MFGTPPRTQRHGAAGEKQPATAAPNSDYRVEAVVEAVRETVAVGGTTRHDSGGKKATAYLGTWVRKGFLGHGACGVVYLENNLTTKMLRAVKQLVGGKTEVYEREIDQLVRVKRVNEPKTISVREYS